MAKQNANNIELIEKASQAESAKSELATEVANQKVEKQNLKRNINVFQQYFINKGKANFIKK
ncbi:hypothetical protein CXF80_01455 [Shewanella sp. Actino-trap-3]|uniref:hypothetical protein n=1 Tax=Shewanella sp. Actino-trap-3 TaxID=2058331 RepID=UPI000C3483C6|nr:hypothetical protein [Shewanella sp. Actino-trap-3]PKG77093.1 hypothetical protein CXF80_01455 [Shewanella sp. Actino-trap-3]